MAHGITMSPKTAQRSWTRLRVILLTPSLIWVVDQVGISAHFRALGHEAVGLDGSKEFVAMARSNSGCEVLHQDFLSMVLPKTHFHGVFANASLFHVPSKELPRVLRELNAALRAGGVLFCSNPRGNNEEGLSDGRYCCFFNLETWRAYVTAAGISEIRHYYRPPGLPRDEQPWLATVWRKE